MVEEEWKGHVTCVYDIKTERGCLEGHKEKYGVTDMNKEQWLYVLKDILKPTVLYLKMSLIPVVA